MGRNAAKLDIGLRFDHQRAHVLGAHAENGADHAIVEALPFEGGRALFRSRRSQEVMVATSVLDDAQIKTLPTQTVEVLPAPPAGEFHVPMWALLRAGKWSGSAWSDVEPYENFHAQAKLRLGYGANPWLVELSEDSSVSQGMVSTLLFQQGACLFGPNSVAEVADNWGRVGGAEDLAGAITLRILNQGAGNLTAGHADNRLIATLAYVVVDDVPSV